MGIGALGRYGIGTVPALIEPSVDECGWEHFVVMGLVLCLGSWDRLLMNVDWSTCGSWGRSLAFVHVSYGRKWKCNILEPFKDRDMNLLRAVEVW